MDECQKIQKFNALYLDFCVLWLYRSTSGKKEVVNLRVDELNLRPFGDSSVVASGYLFSFT